MSSQLSRVAELLAVARELVAQSVFDSDMALELLTTMSTSGLDAQTVGAVTHAKLVLLNGANTPVKLAMVRFALARVVVMLEQRAALKSAGSAT